MISIKQEEKKNSKDFIGNNNISLIKFTLSYVGRILTCLTALFDLKQILIDFES